MSAFSVELCYHGWGGETGEVYSHILSLASLCLCLGPPDNASPLWEAGPQPAPPPLAVVLPSQGHVWGKQLHYLKANYLKLVNHFHLKGCGILVMFSSQGSNYIGLSGRSRSDN